MTIPTYFHCQHKRHCRPLIIILKTASTQEVATEVEILMQKATAALLENMVPETAQTGPSLSCLDSLKELSSAWQAYLRSSQSDSEGAFLDLILV